MAQGSNASRTKPWLTRFINRHFRHKEKLELGLRGLESQLGMGNAKAAAHRTQELAVKCSTRDLARAVFYAPDMDGQAEPGEVVWANLRFDRLGELERRAVLLIGRNHHTLLGLLISSHDKHAQENNWLAIGNGPWNEKTSSSWVRLDKTLMIPESIIQRRGVRIPERRFERLAYRLREDYDWK